jgi:diacylglycerol kinase (ATP)
LLILSATVKRYIIFNPAAGSVTDRKKVLSALARLEPAKLRLTQKRGDAERWAREAIKTNSDFIAVAGGDGTLNEVVNGLAKAARRTRVGLIPLGTGNDFARTLGLPSSLEENIDILKSAAKTAPVDLVRVTSKRRIRYFVNVSAGGFSGLVDRKTTRQVKRTWGPLAYVRGAAAALPNLHAYRTKIKLDDDKEFAAELYNVVIANGRFVAHGLPIAPTADPGDGLLDVVLIPKVGGPELVLLAAGIVLGKHVSSSDAVFRQAKKVAVRSNPGMWFNVDGELIGNAPAVFQIMPRALNFVVR